MNRTTIVAASLVMGASLLQACGGSKQDAQQPSTFNGQYPAGTAAAAQSTVGQPAAATPYAQPTAPAAAPTAAAPAATTDPNAQQTQAAAAATSNPLADQAVKLALGPRAASEAKGMKEDGAPVSGMLQEGQSLTQEFMLMPGKCYTVLAQGLPPVTQVDLQLAAKPIIAAAPPMVLAASSTQGTNASIASGKNCYKNPFPIGTQVVLTVKATKGSGVVGAQVYSK